MEIAEKRQRIGGLGGKQKKQNASKSLPIGTNLVEQNATKRLANLEGGRGKGESISQYPQSSSQEQAFKVNLINLKIDLKKLDFGRLRTDAQKVIRVLKPESHAERRLVALALVMAQVVFSESWLADCVCGVETAAIRGSRMAYFRTVCRDRAKETFDADFDQMAASVSLPRAVYSTVFAPRSTIVP